MMGILTCVIAWMNLEDIVLSEISWTQKKQILLINEPTYMRHSE